MQTIVTWIRIGIGLAWLLCPPVLAVFALRAWRRQQGPGGWKAILPLVLGTAVLANWILLVRFVLSPEPPFSAYLYHASGLTHTLLLLAVLGLIASIAYSRRWQLVLANIVLATVWVDMAYAPAHWLERVDFGRVKVDDRPVPAAIYIGHPTDSEAEIIALANVPGVGDYFLDFSGERFRVATKREFIGFHYGAWTLRPMRQGEFHAQLPDRHLNEFRIPLANGHVLSVQF